MKKNIYAPLFCIMTVFATDDTILEIKAKNLFSNYEHSKVKLLLAQSAQTPNCNELSTNLASYLGWSGHLLIQEKTMDTPQTKQEIHDLSMHGYPLALFVQYLPADNSIEWRLYDVVQAEMIKGKKYGKKGIVDQEWAKDIAHDVWPELLQEPSLFSTKIAYVKRLSKNKKYRSQICLANFDGSDEKIIVDSPTLFVELSFHPDKKSPRLLASEFTPNGIRLVMFDFSGNKKIVLGGDRAIVGASLSANAETVIYTESGNIWSYSYGKKAGTSKHTLLVTNALKCSSARLCQGSHDIIYCSDNALYKYSHDRKKSSLLIENGLAPAYNAEQKTVAFSRSLKGTLQLMLLHEKNGLCEQITYDSGHKTDACFSPCGKYLLYCKEKKHKKALASICLATKKEHILTGSTYSYAYPAWSPCYAHEK